MSAFNPKFDKLPKTLPIFPLPDVLLLPYGELPLRIFEPRYLEMFNDALSGSRLIGIVQPIPIKGDNADSIDQRTEVFKLGTVGRITSFTETHEGTYDLTLTGLIRFNIIDELASDKAYRVIEPDYEAYKTDLTHPDSLDVDRSIAEDSLDVIAHYFKKQKIEADMDSIRQAPLMQLVTALAMSCPFSTLEKQALLQAMDLEEREDILLSLMKMATTETVEPSSLN